MRSTIRYYTRCALAGMLVYLLLVSIANAERTPTPTFPALPPDNLIIGGELIAVQTTSNPHGGIRILTYANPDDTARVGITIRADEQPLLNWGRFTTEEGVDNTGLGIVPAWKMPAGFDRAAFIEATGCTDARVVATDAPRADVTTNELGYFTDYRPAGTRPAEEYPIAGELALCLTPGGHIVQIASIRLTAGEPLAPADALTAAVVAWLESAEEPDGTPAPECEASEGPIRVQVIDEEC